MGQMKSFEFLMALLILNSALNTLAGTPCEAPDGEIGYCVDVENNSPETVAQLCPPGVADLDLDADQECPNEIDV